MVALQGSLLDGVLPSPAVTRRRLARGAWLDHAPGWLAGADDLFARLVDDLDWQGRRVWMYDRHVDQPRLTAHLDEAAVAADPVVGPMARRLEDRYGCSFPTSWLNLYRDGRDSVAWHGDRIAREQLTSLVVIVSVGDRRPFRLRPKGGGRSIHYELGRGDLLVMGGTCQRTWDHSVPKSARPVGPRISVTFRPDGVPG